MKCRDCRWWSWDRDTEDDPEPQHAMCEMTVRRNSEAVHPESQAVADGADGYYVVLWTTSEFGCVQFEAVTH